MNQIKTNNDNKTYIALADKTTTGGLAVSALYIFSFLLIILGFTSKIFGLSVELFDDLPFEAMLFVLLLLAALTLIFWIVSLIMGNRKPATPELVYELSINLPQRKLYLDKGDKGGFLSFDTTYAVFTEKDTYFKLELLSGKNGKLLGTLTSLDNQWISSDVLTIREELKAAGVQVRENGQKTVYHNAFKKQDKVVAQTNM